MDGLTLIAHARAAGLEVRADGERLVIRGPRSAETLALALQARKTEILAILTADDDETAWRVAILRERIPEREPVRPVQVRSTPATDVPSRCSMCGDLLSTESAQSPWRRCGWCVRALWLALNTAHEGITTPVDAA